MSASTSSLTPEQQALRKQGVGASEVAAVLGLDPRRTALDVYLEKVGLAEPFEGNQFTYWGTKLEPVIAAEYAQRHPDYDILPSPTVIGPEPWMLATPDRRVVISDNPAGDRGLECKQRGQYDTDAWGDSGTDEVPNTVAVQCHWGMVCTGMKAWDVAVLLGGNDYREFTLHYDEAIAQELVRRVREFWHQFVLAKVHPPFTGAESDHRFLFRTYPTHTGEMVSATPAVGALALELQHVRAEIDAGEQEKSRLEASLKEFIADRLGVEGPFGKITWKHMNEVSVAAHTKKAHRRFLPKFDKPLD